MDVNFEPLIEVILKINEESNSFSNYIFPTISAFFSAILGGVVAYKVFIYQSVLETEKIKINSVNKLILTIEESFSMLSSMKLIYHGNLQDSPLQRFAEIPTIIKHYKEIDFELESISFITPQKTNNLKKWNQITRIRSMIQNYNLLLLLWNKRNELERPLKAQILENNSSINLTMDDILNKISKKDIASVIDLNEHVINQTDYLLVELNDFLLTFPILAKERINKKILKRYCNILTFSNNNKELLDLLKKTPNVNMHELSQILELSEEQLKEKYHTGYENDYFIE